MTPTQKRKFIERKQNTLPGAMRKLKRANVELAFSRANSIGALRHLHPRRLRNAIINKQVPEGTYKPT